MFESLETYTWGEMTSTPSLSSKGVHPLDHLGEVLMYPSPSNYSQGGFSTSGHCIKGRSVLNPRIHGYVALDTIYSLHSNITFVSLLML